VRRLDEFLKSDSCSAWSTLVVAALLFASFSGSTCHVCFHTIFLNEILCFLVYMYIVNKLIYL
jgi:uncharacterized membrane protein